jgi:hypothetical protein
MTAQGGCRNEMTQIIANLSKTLLETSNNSIAIRVSKKESVFNIARDHKKKDFSRNIKSNELMT